MFSQGSTGLERLSLERVISMRSWLGAAALALVTSSITGCTQSVGPKASGTETPTSTPSAPHGWSGTGPSPATERPKPHKPPSPGGSPSSTETGGRLEDCFRRTPTILGTEGDDRLVGTPKRDVIVAGGGDDLVENLSDEDRVCTGAGRDTVRGTRGVVSFVDLGEGNDRLALSGAWIAQGGPGDDHLVVYQGPARLRGGPGADYIRAVREAPHAQAINTPCVDYTFSTHGVFADLGQGRVRGEGEDRLVNIRCLTGSRHDDVVFGSPRNDGIETLAGSDLVRSGNGNDGVNGGPNADRIYLGTGDDDGFGDAGWDRIYGEGGDDRLEGWTNGDYLEGGTGDDQIFAAFFCEVSGNSYGNGGLLDFDGNNLFGGPGDDYLTGDKGNDRVDGGPGYDQGQGGYRDGRADWISSMENLIDGCLPDVPLFGR